MVRMARKNPINSHLPSLKDEKNEAVSEKLISKNSSNDNNSYSNTQFSDLCPINNSSTYCYNIHRRRRE